MVSVVLSTDKIISDALLKNKAVATAFASPLWSMKFSS